jgi:hypothetical protein
LLSSFEKSAQPPLHAVYPLLHENEHDPPLHVAVALATLVVHGVAVQLPQYVALVCVFTQAPLHSVVGDGQEHVPPVHVSPPVHA